MWQNNSIKLTGKRLLFLARHLILPIYAVEGDCQGTRLKMLVADDGSTLPYINHLTFNDNSKIQKKGVISAFKAVNLTRSTADIVIVGANQLLLKKYAKENVHIVPKYICPLFRMPNGLEAAIENLSYDARKDIRRNIRVALNKGFTYKTTTDPAWFDEFYYKVYMQYGTRKHGALAQIDSYRRVKSAYDKGLGIIIMIDEKPVIGSIVFREGNTLRARYMGVYEGQEEAAHKGGSTAMYYFTMLVAHSMGCEATNMGSTRPFLSDGVLKFKMRWEPEILHDERSTAAFAISAPRLSTPARKFLTANPFFELAGDDIVLYKPVFED